MCAHQQAGLMLLEDKDNYQWRCFMAEWVKSRPEDTYSDDCKSWISEMLEIYVAPCLRC